MGGVEGKGSAKTSFVMKIIRSAHKWRDTVTVCFPLSGSPPAFLLHHGNCHKLCKLRKKQFAYKESFDGEALRGWNSGTRWWLLGRRWFLCTSAMHSLVCISSNSKCLGTRWGTTHLMVYVVFLIKISGFAHNKWSRLAANQADV